MRALLLSPHNDDEVLFASFLCLRYQPHVVICFRSFRMADPAYPGGRPVSFRERELETQRAMYALGCKWTQWPLRDDRPNAEELEAWMIGLRDPAGADDWDHVFAPAIEEWGHDDHNMVGEVALTVFKDVPITWYLTYTTHGRSRGTEIEFEPEWVAKKLHAMACYKSQAAHPATRNHFIDNGLREYVA
jgi:LmbE family N-acetylglucosaminyl deacetylase